MSKIVDNLKIELKKPKTNEDKHTHGKMDEDLDAIFKGINSSIKNSIHDISNIIAIEEYIPNEYELNDCDSIDMKHEELQHQSDNIKPHVHSLCDIKKKGIIEMEK